MSGDAQTTGQGSTCHGAGQHSFSSNPRVDTEEQDPSFSPNASLTVSRGRHPGEQGLRTVLSPWLTAHRECAWPSSSQGPRLPTTSFHFSGAWDSLPTRLLTGPDVQMQTDPPEWPWVPHDFPGGNSKTNAQAPASQNLGTHS